MGQVYEDKLKLDLKNLICFQTVAYGVEIAFQTLPLHMDFLSACGYKAHLNTTTKATFSCSLVSPPPQQVVSHVLIWQEFYTGCPS